MRDTAERLAAPLTLVKREWRWRSEGLCQGGQRLTIYRRGNARHPEYPDLFLPLLGEFQLENACTAVAGIAVLKEQGIDIPADAVREGLAKVQWPGRLQVLSREPFLVVDGAHNPYSARELLRSLPKCLDFERIILLFGAGRTHRPGELLAELLPSADQVYVVRSSHPHAASAESLRDLALEQGRSVEMRATPVDALCKAVATAQPGDLILATGSLFLVAEIMSAWAALQGREPYPSDPPGAY